MMNNMYEVMGGYMGFGSMGIFSFLFMLVVFVDLVLLGAWLWKKLTK